jgi:hypothetical protein
MRQKSKFCIYGLLLLSSGFLFAQKHDNTWIFGPTEEAFSNPDGVIITFDQGYPVFTLDDIGQSYGMYCGICSDSVGNLLFHTNGMKIRNRQHNVMQNGSPINPGADWTFETYLNHPSGAITLPAPGLSNHYYLIHTSINTFSTYFFPILYVTLIDMNANNGLGKVVYKNDTLATGEVPSPVAIKHANGRDWWLIVGDYSNNTYETYLIDPTGIHWVFDQVQSSDAYALGSSFAGYSIASPDGRFFVTNDSWTGLWIYDFDRCSGLLNYPRKLPYQGQVFSSSASSTFSKDSRFFYAGNGKVIYQLDMQTIDSPYVAIDTIAFLEADSIEIQFVNHFWRPQLAPDDKIYYLAFNYRAYHVLNRPTLPLLASDMKQRGLYTPKLNDFTWCHFPAYDLGRLLGSDCDSLPFVGTVEERFRHTKASAQQPVIDQSVRLMRLPPNFNVPEPPKGTLPQPADWPYRRQPISSPSTPQQHAPK